jgi:hypothetical protein
MRPVPMLYGRGLPNRPPVTARPAMGAYAVSQTVLQVPFDRMPRSDSGERRLGLGHVTRGHPGWASVPGCKGGCGDVRARDGTGGGP